LSSINDKGYFQFGAWRVVDHTPTILITDLLFTDFVK